MRTLITITLVLTCIYFGYQFWTDDSGSGTDPSPQANANTGETTNDAPPTPEVKKPDLPPLPPSEKGRLREQASGSGPDADRARWELARILLDENDDAGRGEARTLLREVFKGGGELAVRAAGRLLDLDSESSPQYATFIVQQGKNAPTAALARASFHLGQAAFAKPEESAKIEAWKQLSKAYFAVDDEKWRAPVREKLDTLLNEHLVFSPRVNKATTLYTVQSGDSLARIAREHQTTVDLVRFLNRLEGDMIHPGQRLKVLTGNISIEVKKSTFRLDVRLDGKFLYSAKVGLGEYGKTPLGTFVIDVKQEHPDWQKPGQPVVRYGDPENPLGECWLGFKNTEEHRGYGIHGTSQPDSIGTESSQGCIRMRNEQVTFLYRLIPTGTRVTIRE